MRLSSTGFEATRKLIPICHMMRHWAALTLLVITSLTIAAGCNMENPRVVIYFDNGSNEPIDVTLADSPTATIQPGNHKAIWCEAGMRHVRVTRGAEVLYDGFKDLPKSSGFSAKRYVFNPDSNLRYRVYTVKYGRQNFAKHWLQNGAIGEMMDKLREAQVDKMSLADIHAELLKDVGRLEVPNAWFEIARVDYVLEPAPEVIIKGKYGSDVKHVLARLSVQDYELLQAALENKDPSEDDVLELVRLLNRIEEPLAAAQPIPLGPLFPPFPPKPRSS